jgi:lipopolysaccharide heptosyltransferase II
VGDLLFTTPTVRAFRKALPSAHLAYLVGNWSQDVALCNPHLNEVILFDKPFQGENKLVLAKRSLQTILEIRKKQFDAAVIFHRSASAFSFAALGGIKKRIGFDSPRWRFLCTTKVSYDSQLHEVDRYLGLAEAVGIPAAGIETEMIPTKEAQEYADLCLRSERLLEAEFLVAMQPGGGENPGSKMAIKRWDWKRYGLLADRMAAEFGAKIVLVGGKSDAEIHQKIISHSNSKCKPIDLSGRTTFAQVAAIAQRCQLFVGNDSGPLHIAAAAGTPTISLFGPSDPRLVAPRGEKHRYLWFQIPCAPCYKPQTVARGYSSKHAIIECTNPKYMECMELIEVEQVMAMARQILSRQ